MSTDFSVEDFISEGLGKVQLMHNSSTNANLEIMNAEESIW